ncbi:MAG: hypothetical protein K8T26_01600 [Lentisphaerae bacterium]|nr:hypothetical protein [Lentisphaerota bacterium]
MSTDEKTTSMVAEDTQIDSIGLRSRREQFITVFVKAISLARRGDHYSYVDVGETLGEAAADLVAPCDWSDVCEMAAGCSDKARITQWLNQHLPEFMVLIPPRSRKTTFLDGLVNGVRWKVMLSKQGRAGAVEFRKDSEIGHGDSRPQESSPISQNDFQGGHHEHSIRGS